LFPVVIGFRGSTVVTGSMEPHIRVGDAIVGHAVPPTRIHVGDIVSFQDPEQTGRELTHRVIAARRDGDVVHFATKGDANTSVERFKIPADGRIGLVSYRIPKLGFALSRFRGPPARISLVAVPALVLLVVELWQLWLTPRRREAAAAT
jgi:signal peptidase I